MHVTHKYEISWSPKVLFLPLHRLREATLTTDGVLPFIITRFIAESGFYLHGSLCKQDEIFVLNDVLLQSLHIVVIFCLRNTRTIFVRALRKHYRFTVKI